MNTTPRYPDTGEQRAREWRTACWDFNETHDAGDEDFVEAVNRLQAFAVRLDERAQAQGSTLRADLVANVDPGVRP